MANKERILMVDDELDFEKLANGLSKRSATK